MKAIEVKSLVKRYGNLVALNHLDLTVQEGEIVGLLGPNGGGKTTAIHCILALLKFDHGEINLFGSAMTASAFDIKRQIGFVMQNIGVFDELTVYENIDYFCGLYISDNKQRKQLVEEAIDFVELQEFRKFYPKKLSGGLLRRLNIACGIAHKPKLIILDEPTVAVDPQSRNNILEGIKRLNKEGATILYTSHYMEEVEQLCDRIVIIDNGRQIAMGTKEELISLSNTSEKIVFEVYSVDDKHLEEIKKMTYVEDVNYSHNELSIYCKENCLSEMLAYMEKEKLVYNRVYSERPSLNDLFLEFTGKQLRD